MLNGSGLLYLTARVIAAAGNFIAVAIFSRMAGPAEYGHYVLIFAWALIVYGFGAQWMRFASFGVYHLDRVREYVRLAGSAARRRPGDRRAGARRTGNFRLVRTELSRRRVCAGLRHDGLRSGVRSLAHAARRARRGAVDDAARFADRRVRHLQSVERRWSNRARACYRDRQRGCCSAGARELFRRPPVARLARGVAAHHQIRLAAAIVFRRHRGRPDDRPPPARPLSRRRHAWSLRHGRRRDAAELHRVG